MSLYNQQNPTTPLDAKAFCDLLNRSLPVLWDAQRRSHSRCLRVVLIDAEECCARGASADAVLDLIWCSLSQLWEVQQRTGNRRLRAVLNAAERLQVLRSNGIPAVQ
jgi:hypothetical protein